MATGADAAGPDPAANPAPPPPPPEAATISISQPEEAPEAKGGGVALDAGDGKAKAVPAVVAPATISIVISQPEEAPEAKSADVALDAGDGKAKAASAAAVAAKEAGLARSDSFEEQCRVCQQKTEESLVELGCRCRGDLAKAHRTCIDVWFHTKGSNKCEICQQVAANIPSPETQSSTSYWVWRVDSAYGRGRGGRERGWFSPLWVAFAILIGGLLLDVLISVSLGVSALPVNIIIGVLIVLGLGTALRLALECCQEWGSRASMPRLDNMAPSGYHPAV